MGALGNEAVVSPADIPQNEQSAIVELYRNALLTGSQAQLISPAGKILDIPRPIYNLLVEILKDLSEGASVAILQERQGLTTVQASRLLGVSRQFLVNLIDSGEIAHHMVGTHRRVYTKDLMAYKSRRDRARHAVLGQMLQSELEAGLYDVVPDDFAGQ